MSPAQIIVNPFAGRWKARAALPAIEHACQAISLPYELAITEGKGHATTLAHEAALAGRFPIIVAGGDGTINEVVNGLIKATPDGPAGPLGIIPLGSADDLAYALGLETGVEAACQVVLAGHTRLIDVGQVNGRLFCNNSSVGLEPQVTLMQERIRGIKGAPRYILAAFRSIFGHSPWHMQLEWDEGEYDGPITLVSVGNTRRAGGAFHMTPGAEIDDGYLDFCFAGHLTRARLLRLLPTTFSGAHVQQPDVEYTRATRLRITSEPPTPLQCDGEVFDLAAEQIEYAILPRRLEVLVPDRRDDRDRFDPIR